MLEFKTKSGSIWQLDRKHSRIRRISPTARDWQKYWCYDPIVVGNHAVIYWRSDDPKYAGTRMITTRVVLIVSDSEKTHA